VEQLIRMGATDAAIDRRGLVRDINRLLQKYYALPLKSLDARVIFEEILPVSYEYQLQLPSDLWLLGKTLAMMEGLGKRLAPELNVFAIAEPYVQRLMWQMVKPKSEWVRSALLSGATWSELFNRLPHVGNKVLTHIEQNDPININLDVRERISAKLDRMITRLALSVLVASLIIGLSFLVPATAAYSWVQWILVGGLVGTVILGIWLFISIVRTNL
jgi:ubiquinone biosynthesis protein